MITGASYQWLRVHVVKLLGGRQEKGGAYDLLEEVGLWGGNVVLVDSESLGDI